MIVTALLYLAELFGYALGVARRDREKGDWDGEVGKRLSVCLSYR